MNPHQIIGVSDPTVVKDSLTGLDSGGRRIRVTYANGDYEDYEYSASNPPPDANQPWGRQVGSGVDNAKRTEWDRQAKAPTDKAPQLIHDRQGNPIGYWDPDKPDKPVFFDESQAGSKMPFAIGSSHYYNPTTNSIEPLPSATPPNTQIVTHNNVVGRIENGQFVPIYTDQAGIAKDQAEIDARNRQLQLTQQGQQITSRGQDLNAYNQYMANITQAAQLDETSRQNQFKIDTTLNYDMPRQQVADENAALTSRFQAANTIGQYETNRFNAGRGAAQDRWLGYMQSLPYRASPQFVQEYSQRAAQEAQGVPIGQRTAYSPAALTISGPSMDAQRQAGYAEAGVTGGLPTFDQVLAKAPAFAAMDPAALKKYNDMLMFAYQPPPRSAA